MNDRRVCVEMVDDVMVEVLLAKHARGAPGYQQWDVAFGAEDH